MMRCNTCWKELLPDTAAYATTCSHIFCYEDAKRHFSHSTACPSCGVVLAKSADVFKVKLSLSEDEKGRHLVGLDPETIVEVARNAILFHNYQKECEVLWEQHEKRAAQQRQQEQGKECDEKLEEAQNVQNVLVNENTAMRRERENLMRDLEGMKEKCAQLQRQKRKLEEMFQATHARPLPTQLLLPSNTNQLGGRVSVIPAFSPFTRDVVRRPPSQPSTVERFGRRFLFSPRDRNKD